MRFLICLVIYLLRVVSCVSVSWEHKIFVEKNGTNSSESCGSMHTPCATVNMALQGLTQNSTVIYVGPGTYTLEHGIETTISGLNKLAIIGRSKDSTIINCTPSTGLIFHSSSNITIESISLQYCGKEHFIYWIGLRAAVSFLQCSNVRMSHVAIQFSNGTGLLVECVQEAMIIEYCMVHDSRVNVISDKYGISLIGGGIILLEDCKPPNANSYLIHKSIIASNEFQYYNQPHYDKLLLCPEDLGGGITLMFFVSISRVVVDSSVITNNTRGFSMLGISNGSVLITNSSIYSNVHSSAAIIFSNTFHSLLYFFDVNMTETMMLAFQPRVNVTFGNYQNECTVKSSFFRFCVHFSNTENYSQIPIQLIQTECIQENDITADSLVWGLWFDKVTSSLLHCPLPYAYCSKFGCACAYGRRGRLCGQCKDGYSVPINSNYLSCVQCDKPETVVKGWALLIALEFIPITVMVILIAMLNVNLNQGSLNAYIFFCQIMTVSFPSVGYPAWLLTHEYQQNYTTYLLPLSIWNLNFINIPSVGELFSDEVDYHKLSIHISQSTSPLGAISFWFLIAFYPFVLLILIYICTILYGRGHKCIVYFVRPFHRILARFRRMFNIQPSLIHTAASVFTLCFVQLAATSFKILHPAWYEDMDGKHHSIFFYDGTHPYFRNWHGLAGTFAVMVLMFLIIVTLYLLIHPFQWFQKCLNKVRFKKDFLISVTDAFTGPYKDGTENSWDYRFFSGVHFALRLVIMVFYYIPQDRNIIAGLEATLCVLTATAIIIIRPYKRNIHSFNNMFLLLVLGAFGLYPFYSFCQKSAWHNATYFKFLILPICGSVVLVVVTPYCVLWLIKKVRAGIVHLTVFKLISIQLYNNNNSKNTKPQNQMNNEDECHVKGRKDSENYALIAVKNRGSNYETLNN